VDDPHSYGRVNWAATVAFLVLAACLIGLVWFACSGGFTLLPNPTTVRQDATGTGRR